MPTAFRIVSTLEEEGYLERTDDGLLHPGVAVLTLGSAALRGSSLVQASERPLRALAQATGETVNLGVLQGDEVLYLVRLRNADLVTANIQVGSTLPAAFTSMGKVLLAYLGADDLAERIPDATFGSGPGAERGRLPRRARRASCRRSDRRATRSRTRSSPSGSDRSPSRCSRAAAQPVAAINVAVSVARHDVDALRGPLLERVLAAANEIGVRLAAA